MKAKQGFTLIGLLISIIIIAICAIPTALMFQEATRGSYQTRVLTTATALAEGKIEDVLRLSFSGISAITLTNFPVPFTDYSFQVNVNYVEASDLDTPVVYGTDYKNVEVQVIHNASQQAVAIKSLLTNY